ncbi:MAG: hypothetical protein JW776_04530 [Candidatus Lokiarchaeota archaeon]|nr:hypothetical protein [Candidatus Lokiarchaeota archaeon]
MSRFILRGYSTKKDPKKYHQFRVYLKHSQDKIKLSHPSPSTKQKELIPLRAVPPIARSARGKKNSGLERLAAAEGWRLDLIHSYIDKILEEFKPEKEYLQTTVEGDITHLDDLSQEYMITQDYGIRLAVLFKVIARIQIKSKIYNILTVVQNMDVEELFYWWRKLFEKKDDNKVVTAFRILFED